MINVYSKNETNFNTNGIATLEPTECLFTADINGVWQLDLVLAYDNDGKYETVEKDSIIKVNNINVINEQQYNYQLFRVYDIKKDNDSESVICYPVGLDARFDTYVDHLELYDMTGSAAISRINELTSKYTLTSDINKVASSEYKHANIIAMINGEEGGFVNVWGGEICYDNYAIRVLSRLGRSTGAPDVRYGKNITGMNYELDTTNVVTRLYPEAADGTKLNADTRYQLTANNYVDSPLINDYPFPRNFYVETPYKTTQLTEDGSAEYALSIERYNYILQTTQTRWQSIFLHDTNMLINDEIELEWFYSYYPLTQINDNVQGIVEHIWRKLINNSVTPILDGDVQSLIYSAIKAGFDDIFDNLSYSRSWVQIGQTYYYTYSWDTGHTYAVKSAWIKSGNKWYWVNNLGERGNLYDDGKWKWYKVKGKTYKRYGNKKKKRYLKSQWYKINDVWYYFDAQGKGIKGDALRIYCYNKIDGYYTSYYYPSIVDYAINTERLLIELLYTQMTNYCNNLFTADGLDKPVINMSIDMVDLSKTTMYDGYSDLLNIKLGDDVRCINNKIGIESTEKIVGLTYDVLRGFNTAVKIGLTQSSVIDILTSIGSKSETRLVAGENVVIKDGKIDVVIPASLKDVIVNGESVVDGETAYIDLASMGIDETIDVIYGEDDPDNDEGSDRDFYLKGLMDYIFSEDRVFLNESEDFPMTLDFEAVSKSEFNFTITGIPSGWDKGEHAIFTPAGLIDGEEYTVEFDLQYENTTWMLSHYSDGLEIGSKKIDFIVYDDSLHHYKESFTYTEGDTFEFKFYLADDGRLFTAHFTNFTISGDIKYSKITDIYNKDKEVWIKYEKEGGSGDGEHITLTQAEYNALSDAEKNDPSKFYFIEDAPSSPAGIWIGNTKSNYSTEEKVIGTWIDGKPLYQKTYYLSSPLTIRQDTWVQIQGISIADIDRGVSTICANERGQFDCVISDLKTSPIELWNTRSANISIDSITCQYTKTTDTAYTVPVGDANYYSTSEQIVGRWIDGKPLYQKTLSFTNLTGMINDVPTGISNIEKVCYMEGICLQNNASGSYRALPYAIPSGYTDSIGFVFEKDDAGIDFRLGENTYSEIYITIRYTKTTD
jgi:phage minor structural protein